VGEVWLRDLPQNVRVGRHVQTVEGGTGIPSFGLSAILGTRRWADGESWHLARHTPSINSSLLSIRPRPCRRGRPLTRVRGAAAAFVGVRFRGADAFGFFPSFSFTHGLRPMTPVDLANGSTTTLPATTPIELRPRAGCGIGYSCVRILRIPPLENLALTRGRVLVCEAACRPANINPIILRRYLCTLGHFTSVGPDGEIPDLLA
jgi:hypothetical protein